VHAPLQIMFGYATNETPEMMPLTLVLAHGLNVKMSALRRNGELGWLRPDSKTQVTVEYEKLPNGAVKPLRVDTVVISTQHAEEISTEDLRTELMEKVVKSVIPANLLNDKTVYHIQPSGRFVIGGPQGDAGLTGRKIIVDTYGGWGAHGGGAFSGKDWSSASCLPLAPPPRRRRRPVADVPSSPSSPTSSPASFPFYPFPPSSSSYRGGPQRSVHSPHAC